MIPSAPLLALDVKARADFVAIASRYMKRLRRAGRQFCGLCPFHSERHPSCYVHPEKKIFYCFGCGIGGDLFDFVMRAEGCDFLGALGIVADFSSEVASESDPRRGSRFRAGEGASPGQAKPGLPHRWEDLKPRAVRGACSWPSLDCAAEQASFTCTQRITPTGNTALPRSDRGDTRGDGRDRGDVCGHD